MLNCSGQQLLSGLFVCNVENQIVNFFNRSLHNWWIIIVLQVGHDQFSFLFPIVFISMNDFHKVVIKFYVYNDTFTKFTFMYVLHQK